MIRQTDKPVAWIIVDDGSSDLTREIIARAAVSHPWIHAVHRRDRGARVAGSGVMEAFHTGLNEAQRFEWDFLVKLDGDLVFRPDCFAASLAQFARDPLLGIGGGTIAIRKGRRTSPEYRDPLFHVRGPCKIYRKACWESIDGLIRAPGWDTFDLIKAQSKGWRTKTFPEVQLIHLRPTGGAYGSWANWVKNGVANYNVGYHPLFMLAKCLRRIFRPPFGVAAAGLLAGFLKGYWQHLPRVKDVSAISFLRREQLNHLRGSASLWRPRKHQID
jgi:glycosyltransferase involved in cell wall biosynthesis